MFWKIPHTSGETDLRFKPGRYRRSRAQQTLDRTSPKSELTLDNAEFEALLDFIGDNVEPLRAGARSYVVIDNSYQERIEAVRELLANPDEEQLVDLLVREKLVPDDVRRALEHRARCTAVEELETMLEQDLARSNGSVGLR